MSRQDKATTDRNARTLRELVKQPDNKACADCRKNDARWASWNLGVYLCIRCSGIHRSMGTHISKVKSIDLDIWTPEQMETIQKWGNRRANLYWERHLKSGHVPPDHKIESFIRSKYESKRWAMDGPPPSDPSVLEQGGNGSTSGSHPTPTPTSSAPPPAPAPLAKTHPLLSRTAGSRASAPAPTPAPASAPILDLFSDDTYSAPSPAPTAAPTTSARQPTATAPQPTQGAAPPAPTQQPSNIFDLDFRAPTPSTTSRPQTAKADILSLYSTSSNTSATPSTGSFFSAPPPITQGQNQYASWSGSITSSSPPKAQQTQMNIGGSGGWGSSAAAAATADQNAWGGFSDGGVGTTPQQAQYMSGGGGGQKAQQSQNSMDPWGSDPWGSAAPPQATTTAGQKMGGMAAMGQPIKKDDPFANIWQ